MNELSKQLKINSIEKNIDPYDVYNADEAFMTVHLSACCQ